MDDLNLDPEEVEALKQMIKDRLWWSEATKRAKRIGLIAGGFFAVLAFVAMWWPWITRIVQLIIKDVPIQ